MKLLFKLLKVDIINTLALAQYKTTRKHKAKSISPLISSVLVMALMAVVFTIYAYFIAMAAHSTNNDSAIIVVGVGFGGLMTLLMTFGKAHSILFKGKDFELLSSLPIPTKTIVASKICSLLVVNYIYFIIGYLPSFIFYLMYTGFGLTSILIGLVVLLLGPLFPTTICAVFSFLIGAAFSKSRFKNILSTITSVLLVIVIFVATFSLEMTIMSDTDENAMFANLVGSLENVFSKGYFLSAFAAKAMNGELLYLLYYSLISIIPIIIFIFVVAKTFVRINASGSSGYKNKNFKLDAAFKKEKQTGIISTLVKRETKRLFNIPTYSMNVLTGPVLGVALVVVLSLTLKNLELPHMVGILIIMLGSMFAMNMIPASGSSISIEGKTLWILKSSPIKTEHVLLSKVIMSVLLCIPTILINIVLALVLWHATIIDCIFLLVVPLIGVSAMAALALWINTCKYRLDWINPVQAVKQGTETLLSMLLSYLLDAILIVPTVVVSILGFYGPIVTLACAAIVAAITFTVLFKNGKKRYEAIEV